METKQIAPDRTGIIMFLITFGLGLVVFLGFGVAAGVFAGKGLFDAFRDSPAGWASLFGVTLMLASPFIGLTAWAVDRAAKSIVEQNTKK